MSPEESGAAMAPQWSSKKKRDKTKRKEEIRKSLQCKVLGLLGLITFGLVATLLEAAAAAKPEEQPPNELLFSNQTGAVVQCGLALELARQIAQAEQGNSSAPLDIRISWQKETGEPVEQVLYGADAADQQRPLRYVRQSDGALVFEPFRPADFRADVHATAYRCLASSGSRAAATLVSREMRVRALVVGPAAGQPIEVLDELAVEDQGAQFRCQVPGHARDHLQVLDWIEYPGETLLSVQSTTLLNGQHLFGKKQRPTSNATQLATNYFVHPKTGDLHLASVQTQHNYRSYKCRCKNKLTGELVSSANRGKLIVTESQAPAAPQFVDALERRRSFGPAPIQTELRQHSTYEEGELGLLSCNTQSYPPAQLTWFRRPANAAPDIQPEPVDAQLQPDKFAQVGGLLLINRLARNDSAVYLCLARSSLGEERRELELQVRAPLSAKLTASAQVLELGKSLALECSLGGFPIHQVVFRHNGHIIKSISGPGQLEQSQRHRYTRPRSRNAKEAGYFVVDEESAGEQQQQQPPPQLKEAGGDRWLSHVIVIVLEPEHAGAYQCFAQNQFESVHSSAYIRVLDDPPKFKDTFRGEVFEPGQEISLQCSARANPLPEITWSIDEQPIPESARHRFGDYVTKDNLVISYVNISQAQVLDTGHYRCVADNGLAQVSHQALISVAGALQVKSMANLTLVSGSTFRLRCPVAGYPVQEVQWLHQGHRLPANHRQQVHENGSLQVEHMEKSQGDEGDYTCVAIPPGGSDAGTAHGTVHVSIKVRPTIEPFAVGRALREGQRASIMCTISSGDLPIAIVWFKDNRPLVAPQVSSDTARLGAEQQEQQPQLAASLDDVQISRVSDYSSTLLFESLQVHHSGNYTCLARNEAGSSSHQAPMVVQVAPKWSLEPADASVVRGSSASIDCMASGFPSPRIIWTKAEPAKSAEPQSTAAKAHHLGAWRSIVSSPHLQVYENGSLSILEARDSDHGHYMCQAANGVGPGLSKVVRVTINVAAQFSTKHSIQYVAKGEPAQLKCQAKGDWPLAVHWLRNKHRLEPINAQDLSSSGSPPAAGHLAPPTWAPEPASRPLASSVASVLMAPGQIGQLGQLKGPSLMEQLAGLLAPSNSEQVKPPAGGLLMQRYLLLSAEFIVSSNTDKRSPYEQQQQTSTSSPLAASKQQPLLVQVSSTLSIQLAERQDSGLFKCLAANNFGLDERTIQLVVQEQPDKIEQVSVLDIGSRSVLLAWLAPFDGNAPLLSYHVQYRAANEAGWANLSLAANESASSMDKQLAAPGGGLVKMSLAGLRPVTRYWFRVEAENKLGRGQVSGAAEALTLEEAPGAAPTKLKAAAQSSSSILVSWQRLAERDVFGHIQGYYVAYKQLLEGAKPADQSADQSALTSIYKTIQHDDKLTKFDALLTGLKRSTSYLVSVQAFNARGTGPSSEPLIVKTLEMDPPRQVRLFVRHTTNCTIQLEWRPLSQAALKQQVEEAGPPKQPDQTDQVDYYNLYRAELSDRPRWLESRLPGHASGHLLEGLRCGARYQFYMMGVNKVGVGEQSDILDTKTAGGLPRAPDRQASVDVINATCYVIRLDRWQDNGCPIEAFSVSYRAQTARDWTPLARFNLHQTDSHRRKRSLSADYADETDQDDPFSFFATDYAPDQVDYAVDSTNRTDNSRLLSLLKDSMQLTPRWPSKQVAAALRADKLELVEEPAARIVAGGPTDWRRVRLCHLQENLYYTVQISATNSVGETESELRLLTAPEGVEWDPELKRHVVSRLGADRPAQSANIQNDGHSLGVFALRQWSVLLPITLTLTLMTILVTLTLLLRRSHKSASPGPASTTTTASSSSSSSSSSGAAGAKTRPCRAPVEHATNLHPTGTFDSTGSGQACALALDAMDSGRPGYAFSQHLDSSLYQRAPDEPAYGIVPLVGGHQLFNPNSCRQEPSRSSGSPPLTSIPSSSQPSTSGSQAPFAGRSAVYLCSTGPLANKEEPIFYGPPSNQTAYGGQACHYGLDESSLYQQQAGQRAFTLTTANTNLYAGRQEILQQEANQIPEPPATDIGKLDNCLLTIVEEVARANEGLASQQQRQEVTVNKPMESNEPSGMCFEGCQAQIAENVHYNHQEMNNSHNNYPQQMRDGLQEGGDAQERNQMANRLMFDPVYATIRRTFPQAFRYLTLQQNHQQLAQARHSQQLNGSRQMLCNHQSLHEDNHSQNSLAPNNGHDLAMFNSNNLAALNLLTPSNNTMIQHQAGQQQ